MPLLPRTCLSALIHQSGEILAIVDRGTSKHMLQCRTLLANAQEAHVAVSSFAGDTSRSTYSGDLLCTIHTEDGKLLPLSDTSSALVVPDAKRPLWSVRHAQIAGHEIVLGAKPGLLLQGNPRYFVPFINCPETGLWLIRLFLPPTLHNRIYPIHLATNSDIPTSKRVPTSPDTTGSNLWYKKKVSKIWALQELSTDVLHWGWKWPPPPQNTSTVVENLNRKSILVGLSSFCFSFRNTSDWSGLVFEPSLTYSLRFRV